LPTFIDSCAVFVVSIGDFFAIELGVSIPASLQ
jgi:hypothetical protein